MDILDDSGNRELIALGKKYTFPSYVLACEPLTKEASAQLPEQLFADPFNRKFPINDDSNTWLSTIYFNENQHLIKNASDRKAIHDTLMKAADIYGIYHDVAAVFDEIPEFEKIGEDPDEAYAYVDEDTKAYPLFSRDDIKTAEVYFLKYRHNYKPEVRRKIASRLVKRAGTFHCADELSEEIHKEAGNALPNVEGILRGLTDAALYVDNTEDVNGMVALMRKVSEAPLDVVDELAPYVTEIISKAIGPVQGWSPADVVYGTTVKEASNMVGKAFTIGKNVYDLEKLAELPEVIFRQALGNNIAEKFIDFDDNLNYIKMGEVLSTVPKNELRLLEQAIMQACE